MAQWIIDDSHSLIQFTVRHMMISKVRGRFDRFNGTITADEQNPANSSVNVQIDAASINTRDAKRDGHLTSPDFLDVASYPYITFVSKRIETLDASRGRLIGDLTIRGVTREVTLDVEYNGQARSPWGTVSAGFHASTTINRKDWGLTWNMALETGGVLVGDEVEIDIEVELIRQEEQQEAVEATATSSEG